MDPPLPASTQPTHKHQALLLMMLGPKMSQPWALPSRDSQAPSPGRMGLQ